MTFERGRGVIPSSFFIFAGLISVVGLISCNKKAGPSSSTGASEPSALVKRGRSVYQTQCIACHNSNPRKVGALGPDVYGSSRELLEARILRGEYPPGYKPKRETHVMGRLPHLKSEIDAIHAYLNSNE